MMFIEIYLPAGRFDTGTRTRIVERVATGLVPSGGAPEVVLDGARAMTQVVVHEPVAWQVGDSSAPPFVVRLTLPASVKPAEASGYYIPRITGLLAEFADDPGLLHREPHAWVRIVGLDEGAIGALGRPLSSTDLTRMITAGYRNSGGPAQDGVDPVCGMRVDPATATLTHEHAGRTYAFCAPVCREVFLEELAAAG